MAEIFSSVHEGKDTNALYHLNGVQKIYDGRTVLDVPQMAIYQGEVLGIVGPSGAGKSTLLRMLAFLERPSRGELIYRNRLYAGDWPPLDERRSVTMLFQDPHLLRRSVYDNIAYGLALRGKKNGGELVDRMIDQLGLSSLRDAPARTLSGGEAQRVALARSLVLEPEILILDEPTSNLDPSNIKLIEAMIQRVNFERGMTVVIVTHNVFQARRLANRVCLILGGELIEVSETADFFEQPKQPQTAAFVKGDIIY